MSKPDIYQCASCKRVFRTDENAQEEALNQLNRDFPLDPNSLQAVGGIHKVCLDCYNKHMNKGLNSTKHETLKRWYRIIKSTLTKI